jgi:hypothetical protein
MRSFRRSCRSLNQVPTAGRTLEGDTCAAHSLALIRTSHNIGSLPSVMTLYSWPSVPRNLGDLGRVLHFGSQIDDVGLVTILPKKLPGPVYGFGLLGPQGPQHVHSSRQHDRLRVYLPSPCTCIRDNQTTEACRHLVRPSILNSSCTAPEQHRERGAA